MAAPDSEPGALDNGSRSSRRPQYQNTINLGQIGTILSIVGFFGSGLLYQRTETEAIRSAAAVRDERLIAVQKEVQANKEAVALQAAGQKEVLTEIKGDVKNIGSNMQALTMQVQQLSLQQQPRRP